MPNSIMGATSQQPSAHHATTRAGLIPLTYDDALGIVHHEGCRTCRHYMMHISDPILQDSYTLALRQRDEELRCRFVEGFRRGRSTQQQHDSERLKDYRAQRDEARSLEAACKLQLEEASVQVAQLREELLTLQIFYGELCSPVPDDWDEDPLYLSNDPNILTSGDETLDSHTQDDSDEGDSERGSSRSDEGEFDFVKFMAGPQTPEFCDDIDSPDDNSDDDDYDTESDSTTVSNEEKLYLETAVEVVEGCDNVLDHEPAAAVPGPALQLNMFPFATPRDTSGDTHAVFLPQSFKFELPSSQPSNHLFSSLHPPIPISVPEKDPLSEQMKLVHDPDNPEILAHVKSLVSEAHHTDSRLRTETQKVSLTEWTNPSPLASPQLGETVYVDASGIGIGFVSGGRWQAWQWKKTWKQDGRDIQWAEAVAVEMGIRLMIASGHSGKKIILYSDNSQVVDAISGERSIGEFYASQIVNKIDHLCKEYDIQLKVLWVPGEQNPADAPSRLIPIGRGKTRHPHQINIPEHLKEFVLPWLCRAF